MLYSRIRHCLKLRPNVIRRSFAPSFLIYNTSQPSPSIKSKPSVLDSGLASRASSSPSSSPFGFVNRNQLLIQSRLTGWSVKTVGSSTGRRSYSTTTRDVDVQRWFQRGRQKKRKRRWHIDQATALAAWLLIGNGLFFLVRTTTFLSILFALANILQLEGMPSNF
jgi:hypothetical protein